MASSTENRITNAVVRVAAAGGAVNSGIDALNTARDKQPWTVGKVAKLATHIGLAAGLLYGAVRRDPRGGWF